MARLLDLTGMPLVLMTVPLDLTGASLVLGTLPLGFTGVSLVIVTFPLVLILLLLINKAPTLPLSPR